MREATLIALLERAAGPDDKLDKAIAELADTYSAPDRGSTDGNWPNYTASIDAALTLVPEGWAWSVREGGCYATGRELKPRAELAEPIETEFGPGVGVRTQIEAVTPPIAICIAALKARAL